MREIDAGTAAEYLRAMGRVPAGSEVAVRELAGGVSNIVLRVDVEGEPPYVVKQCRERLRVAMEWRAPLERIWVEEEALELLGRILPDGAVPRVLFDDRANYLFAMTCAADDAATWKTRLMAGDVDSAIARRVGEWLGLIHDRGATEPALGQRLADRSLFEHLRVDPYYRTLARSRPALEPAIDRLIATMDDAALDPAERTLVLGDYSPKNILVDGQDRLTLLDFECAHVGDPAFDLGFCLSHLMLKAARAARGESARAGRAAWPSKPGGERPYLDAIEAFWEGYVATTGRDSASDRGRRGVAHMAACCAARVDGKSPVEYLDAGAQEAVRACTAALLECPGATWSDARALAGRLLFAKG